MFSVALGAVGSVLDALLRVSAMNEGTWGLSEGLPPPRGFRDGLSLTRDAEALASDAFDCSEAAVPRVAP
jgi:hypothetical protein